MIAPETLSQTSSVPLVGLAAAPLHVLAAYRPFLDPIDAHKYWFLLIVPLAIGISFAYKAVRVSDLREFPRQLAVMTIQIILAMIGLGIAFYLFVQFVVPFITPRT